MARESLSDMHDLAVRLANEVSDIAREGFGAPVVSRKADRSVVTETDHAMQATILGAIADTYPEHAVRAEETVARPDAHADPTDARFCWVVDPLDGTRNFAAGLPWFATSIAVLDRGRPIVGVVREHGTGITYAATAGGGATVNGTACRACDRAVTGDMLVAVPSNKDPLTQHVLQTWAATPRFVLRNVGTTATHLALVASGALAAAFANRCKLWDIAAGALLVIEAGGRITDPRGNPCIPFDLGADSDADFPFLAAGPQVHRRLLPTMTRTGTERDR